jgi:hypothetical protein
MQFLSATYGGPESAFTTFSASAPVTPLNNTLHVNVFLDTKYKPPPPGTWNGWSPSLFPSRSPCPPTSYLPTSSLQSFPIPEPRPTPFAFRTILDTCTCKHGILDDKRYEHTGAAAFSSWKMSTHCTPLSSQMAWMLLRRKTRRGGSGTSIVWTRWAMS